MSPKKQARKSARNTAANKKRSRGFTDEERAAMKERAGEVTVETRRGADKAEGESAVLAKIAEMPEPDRSMAKRLHAIIKASAPALSPKTWYGMPVYAKDGSKLLSRQRRAGGNPNRRARSGSMPLRRECGVEVFTIYTGPEMVSPDKGSGRIRG